MTAWKAVCKTFNDGKLRPFTMKDFFQHKHECGTADGNDGNIYTVMKFFSSMEIQYKQKICRNEKLNVAKKTKELHDADNTIIRK